jgi:hypothetical protein
LANGGFTATQIFLGQWQLYGKQFAMMYDHCVPEAEVQLYVLFSQILRDENWTYFATLLCIIITNQISGFVKNP